MGRKVLGIERGRGRRGLVIGARDLNDRIEVRNKMDEDIVDVIVWRTDDDVQRPKFAFPDRLHKS